MSHGPQAAGDLRPDMVTSVILHELAAGMDESYKAWLARIIPVAASFPGHRGVDVIPPPEGSRTYTVAIRFDDLASAQAWFESDARRRLINEVEPLLQQAEKVSTVTGLEFWFEHPKGAKPPRPFKQFLLVLSVIYPCTLIVPPLVHQLTGDSAFLNQRWVDRLIVAILIVALMTYVVMPRYTRFAANWLRR